MPKRAHPTLAYFVSVRAALAAFLAVAASACVKEISSDERLDRATQGAGSRSPIDEAAVAKVSCKDAPGWLAKARSEARGEADKLAAYLELYEGLKKRTAFIEEALRRNPDLAYQTGSEDISQRRDICVQQSGDVRMEFERYIRDLVAIPTVQELRKGNTVAVARVDFAQLRKAIDSLDPEDKELLVSRVSNAERRLDSRAAENLRAPAPRQARQR
jgi:hypothetical protein